MPKQSIAGPLHGRVVFVAVSGSCIGPELAAGLLGQGAKVALLTDAPAHAGSAEIKQVQTRFDSRAAMEQAFATATSQVGPVDLLVHSATPDVALESAAMATLSEQHIIAACDAAMKSTLFCFQAGFTQMSERGGAMVVVGPSLSLVGAAGLVPLSTAVEGQRSMVKTAARQWGSRGITVNWVGVASERISPKLTGLAPAIPELGPPPPALGHAPDIPNEVVPVIAFLGSDAARAVTGITMNLDGGDWMVP
jgi:NAD(P)-dependent dehydrogenase (short-subunit alcohol dehydrogenase family)